MKYIFSLLELCIFKERSEVYGNYELLPDTDTKQGCAKSVRDLFPRATGLSWNEDKSCRAVYGNELSEEKNDGLWSCLFNGKKYRVSPLGECLSIVFGLPIKPIN